MYFLIGISLLFAYLYAANLGGSLVTTGAWSLIRRPAERLGKKTRADVIFAFRVLPLAVAIALTFALLIPSFLIFEPHESGESVSWKLAALVAVSMIGIGAAGSRIFGSWWRTRRLTAEWLRSARPFELEGFYLPAYRIEHPFPVLAVIGVMRPKIFVATQVLEALEPEELNAAMAHEVGHVSSRDNLKRVGMRLCGDMLVLPVGHSIDKSWLEAAEAAADEFASADGQGLNLASALVKIGRIAPDGMAWELPSGAYLTEPGDGSIAARVENLVSTAGSTTPYRRSSVLLVPVLIGMLVMIGLALNGNVLFTVHRATESVLAFLE